ncbi:MAG TPA: Gfo/Idh/MocA family oxidoreductase [Kiritimatiellia bacterium]|nr:Gfo/Idh/MocA family oxidoreductase [Kiritimatiellia bacterium]HRU69758.1 Gfo/Idh/MocA family oxidoreductase [Kiritimatiellia bacterium]
MQKINRRVFLKGATLGAAALAAPTIIPATAFGANERIALGCIGVGGMGTGNMRNFLAADACRVVAVCDVQRDRRERAKKTVDEKYGDTGCAMYGDYRELLARKDIDAVMIAAQDHWHSLIATAAAKAKKDMYCEKPTGVCINDGFAIRKAVRKHKRVFQSGMWQRSLGNFRQGCELALNGYLGKITEIEVAVPAGKSFQPKYKGPYEPQPVPDGFDWAMWLGPARFSPFNPARVTYPDWYLHNDYCEGWTTNWGVHHLDIAHWGCPLLSKESFEIEVSDVSYYVNQGFGDNIATWKAVLAYESGLRVVFTDAAQKPQGTKFIGEKGWVYVDRNDKIVASDNLLSVRPKEGDTRLLPVDSMSFDDVTTIKTKDGERTGYKNVNHAEGLLNAMRSRKDPIADIDATHVASTLGMITGIAARLQQKLKWDWKTERFVGNDLANAMLVRPMHNGWKLDV